MKDDLQRSYLHSFTSCCDLCAVLLAESVYGVPIPLCMRLIRKQIDIYGTIPFVLACTRM